MGRRLMLDTNVLIAYERGTIERAALDADELAIAAVSVAEYRAGIELADSAERAADRARALAAITSAVDVLSTPKRRCPPCAADRARPPGWSARGAPDLIIAAHALQTERMVLTFDAKARLGDLGRSERHRRVSAIAQRGNHLGRLARALG